jgi:ankyrin repeat protein
MKFDDDRRIEFSKLEPSSPTSLQWEGAASILEGRLTRFLLLEYAIQYWGNHGRMETTPAIISLAVEFCSNEPKPHCISMYLRSAMISDRSSLAYYLSRFKRGVIDMTNLQGTCGLYVAAFFNLTEVLNILLKTTNLDINLKDGYGRTPLDWTVDKNHYECTLLLLGMKTLDLQTPDPTGRSPGTYALINAVVRGHNKIVHLLLQREEIDIHADNDGALNLAVIYGHTDVLRLLFGKNDVDGQESGFGSQSVNNAVVQAVDQHHTEVVRYLLKRKEVNVNGIPNTTYEQMPLILFMVAYGYVEETRLLLERSDIDVNARDYRDQSTVLITAIKYGQKNIVRILLERKDIDIHAQDNDGKTALSWAQEFGYDSIADILKSRI